MIYLDNSATTCPKPANVVQAVNYATLHLCANPGRSGHTPSLLADESVYKTREKLADFFDCPEVENIIFTKNCTEALNTAIRGCLKNGDHVVSTVLEHNSVLRVLEDLNEQGVITYDLAPVFADDEETVAQLRKRIKSNTKLIVCTHVSNVFGTVLPIRKIGELAAEYGLHFIVDAAQSAGILPVRLSEYGISAICAPGHKGLYGPLGTGCLVLASGFVPVPLMCGGTGSFSNDLIQPQTLPDRYESGTLNVPGIAGLAAGVEFVKKQGVERIFMHETHLIDILKNGLSAVENVEIIETGKPQSICSFNIVGMHSEEAARRLNSVGIAVRGGYHCAYHAHRFCGTDETGSVRVSPSVFTRVFHVEELIKNVRKIVKEI